MSWLWEIYFTVYISIDLPGGRDVMGRYLEEKLE